MTERKYIVPRMGKRFRRGKGNQHTPNGYAQKKWKRVRALHQLLPPLVLHPCLSALAAVKGEGKEPCPVCGSTTHDFNGHTPNHD